jgi:RNA polymerase sigma-70 factor (ECF subfamily)
MSIIQPPPVSNHGGGFESIATRQSLLDRLKNWQDQTSWQDFFDTYWRLIYNVAMKAGLTDAEAQEVVQETVIAVARNISSFETDPNRGSFSAWLMRLTHWRINDQFRKRRGAANASLVLPARERPPDDTGSTEPLQRVPDPATGQLERLWTQEWETNLMAVALERVKRQVRPRQYQMFDLHVLQNLTVQDTARTLRVSTASVYMAKSRISRLLRRTVKTLQQHDPGGW